MVISLKKRKKKNLIFIHSLAQRTNQETSYSLLSLAQRKKQRNIHPNQTFPYIGRLNQKVAEADDFLTVLVSRDTAWIIYRLRDDTNAGHAMFFI